MNKGCDSLIPMSLAETLQTDLVAAMKAGDDVKKTTLRAVITSIKTAQTAEGGTDLDDAAIEGLIRSQAKQRVEAAEIYDEAGEMDRAANERAELEVLESYLPKQLSDDDLQALVESVIADGGYSTKKDMGSAIKDVMARAQGQADGKRVSSMVGPLLG